jgi:hypothetical protein
MTGSAPTTEVFCQSALEWDPPSASKRPLFDRLLCPRRSRLFRACTIRITLHQALKIPPHIRVHQRLPLEVHGRALTKRVSMLRKPSVASLPAQIEQVFKERWVVV